MDWLQDGILDDVCEGLLPLDYFFSVLLPDLSREDINLGQVVELQILFFQINVFVLENDVLLLDVEGHWDEDFMEDLSENLVFNRNFDDFFDWNLDHLFDGHFNYFLDGFLYQDLRDSLSVDGPLNGDIHLHIHGNVHVPSDPFWDFLQHLHDFRLLNELDFGDYFFSRMSRDHWFGHRLSYTNDLGLAFRNLREDYSPWKNVHIGSERRLLLGGFAEVHGNEVRFSLFQSLSIELPELGVDGGGNLVVFRGGFSQRVLGEGRALGLGFSIGKDTLGGLFG